MKTKKSLLILGIVFFITAILLFWSGLSFSIASTDLAKERKPKKSPKHSCMQPTTTPTPTVTPTITPTIPTSTPTNPLATVTPTLSFSIRSPDHALVHFSFVDTDNNSVIPLNATITSAKLSLYAVNVGGPSANPVNIYKIIDPDNLGMWREGTSTSSYVIDGAAFLRRDGPLGIYDITVPWTLAEGSTIYNAISYPASGSILLPINYGYWADSKDGPTRGLKDDVQEWLANPVLNQGWFLEDIVRWTGICHCASRHYPNNPLLGPKLTVAYTLPSSSEVHTVTIYCDADVSYIAAQPFGPYGFRSAGQAPLIPL